MSNFSPNSASGDSWWEMIPRVVACISLIALVLLTYREAPENAFHLDDYRNIVERDALHLSNLDAEDLHRAMTGALLVTRPLANVSLAIDWWRGNGSPRPFIWTNIVIHVLGTLSVFGLLLTIAGRSRRGKELSLVLGATIGAAVWAVHPIQVQGVTYIVQRMTSLAALFTILSVWFYVLGRTRGSSWWFALCGISFVLGVASKENAYVVPALWFLAEYGICRHGRPLYTARLDLVLWSLPPMGLMYLGADMVFHGPLYDHFAPGFEKREFSLVERLLTQPRVIALHLSQVVWPLPGRFSIEHSIALSRSLLQPLSTLLVLLGVVAWCVLGLVLILTRHLRLLGFLVLWVPACLFIESSVIPLEMVFEHRMYLPMVGIAGSVMLGFLYMWRVAKNLRYLIGPGACVVVFLLCASTIERIPVWKTELQLYQHAARHAPDSGRVHSTIGTRLYLLGRFPESERSLIRALELNPRDPVTHNELGNLYLSTGRTERASDHYEKALAYDPTYDKAKVNLAFSLSDLGQDRGAIAIFMEVLASNPRHFDALYGLALASERDGQLDEAARIWRKYVRDAPDSPWTLKARQHLMNLDQKE